VRRLLCREETELDFQPSALWLGRAIRSRSAISVGGLVHTKNFVLLSRDAQQR